MLQTIKILRKIDGSFQFVGYAQIQASSDLNSQLKKIVASYGYDYRENLFLIEELKNENFFKFKQKKS